VAVKVFNNNKHKDQLPLPLKVDEILDKTRSVGKSKTEDNFWQRRNFLTWNEHVLRWRWRGGCGLRGVTLGVVLSHIYDLSSRGPSRKGHFVHLPAPTGRCLQSPAVRPKGIGFTQGASGGASWDWLGALALRCCDNRKLVKLRKFICDVCVEMFTIFKVYLRKNWVK